MKNKKKLLSIGELSKLTGVGIKSLRYYERINVLKPAHVSPETGYRYYTLDQTRLVEMIMFCIAMDLPLSEMAKFTDADGIMDIREFFKKCRFAAEVKLKLLQKGLSLLDIVEHEMDLAEQHKIGQIYTRDLPAQIFHTMPCGDSLQEANFFEMLTSSWDNIPYAEDDYGMYEYGTLWQDNMYSIFIEVPEKTENTIITPAGRYHCIQNEESQIENAAEIFKEHISGKFLAIETEIFTSRQNVTKPINELRVIPSTAGLLP
ncbi:MAG: MerR family DNA-binding transcriptional regulator [Defluviitaleaceae bacterium]|nr:MerR family DNA-binding transcriptional regulator [Defluviitaleaceae bacterium]